MVVEKEPPPTISWINAELFQSAIAGPHLLLYPQSPLINYEMATKSSKLKSDFRRLSLCKIIAEEAVVFDADAYF